MTNSAWPSAEFHDGYETKMHRDQPLRRKTVILASIVATSLLVLSGCGRSPPEASVTGTVSYLGKPVTSGLVVMMAADGRASIAGRVRADGTYTIHRSPTGKVTVVFFNSPPPKPPVNAYGLNADDPEVRQMLEDYKNFSPTPARYSDPKQSGITADLKPGKNECRIDLK